MSGPLYKFQSLFCTEYSKTQWLSNPTLSNKLSLNSLFQNYWIAFQFVDVYSVSPDHKDMTTPIYYYNVNENFNFNEFSWFISCTLWRDNLSFSEYCCDRELFIKRHECPRIIIYHFSTTFFFFKKILNFTMFTDFRDTRRELFLNICQDLKNICDNPKVDFFELCPSV